MRIVLFAHPAFMASQSMPRFAAMLQRAFTAQGHEVQVWSPKARVRAWIPDGPLSKWAGYFDQYLLFPVWVRRQVRRQSADTLFVMTDQAQGPWVPHVLPRPLVVHTHDLLALRSALGEIPENPTGWSGRIYQRYIRRGFSRARHFICISQRTRTDLLRLADVPANGAAVVYNGLNQRFCPMDRARACKVLDNHGLPAPATGWLLHLSGGQWYKNVPGVIRMYAQFARQYPAPPPLWLVGVKSSDAVRLAMAELPPQAQVQFHFGLPHEALQAAYAGALAFLFPSHAEGFGWPIVEAQACGCPVITTDDAPMNEIGGPETTYLPRLQRGADPQHWAAFAATRLIQLLESTPEEARRRQEACVTWAQRFTAEQAISQYLKLYAQVLQDQFEATSPPLAGPTS